MKKFIALLFLLVPSVVQAQIIPTLPVTLTNGSLADANQVMSNFNTIVTGVNTKAAKNGINNDITALNALSTPITPAQGGSSVYTGSGTGTANAQLVTTPTPINYALTPGNTIIFIPGVTNTGATTLSVAGTTIKNVLRQTSSGLQPLVGGEILINQQSMAVYDGTQYELLNSAVTANVPVGTIIDTAGVVVPAGYLAANGASESRVTFSTLFNVISVTGVAATTTSGNASVVVPNSALFQIGWSVGGTNVTCNSTITAIPDGTHITISNTAGGNGSTTLTIGPYPQGDCSTTFNLPNLQGRTTVMADAAGSTLTATTCTNPASIGTACGAQTNTLVTGNLPPYTPTVNSMSLATVHNVVWNDVNAIASVSAGGTPGAPANVANTFLQTVGVTGTVTMNAQGGTSTAFSIVQPIGLVTKAIKF